MAKIAFINNESGIALVIALVMLLALTVIGISALMTSTLDTQISGNERRVAEALNLADAGMERGVMDLLKDFSMDSDWSNATFTRRSASLGGSTGDLPSAASNYGNLACTPRPTCIDNQWGDPFGSAFLNGAIGNAVDLYGGPRELGTGSENFYRVLLLRQQGASDEAYIRSYALHSTGAKKIVQVHVDVDKVDAWRNAIFAGRGSGTNVIQGNIKVAGSIHILGTGEQDVVFALSGSAAMINGYKDLAASLKSRLYDDYIKKTTLPNGTEVETLEAVLRVKRGQVDISGSGNIGEDTGTGCPGGCPEGVQKDAAGDLYKANVDAIFANYGFTNSASLNNVYADNFNPEVQDQNDTDEYDLGDKVQMPQFNDRYQNQTDRFGQTCSQQGITCDTYENYIEQVSYALPQTITVGADTINLCNLVPKKSGDTDETKSFCIGCDSSGNCGTPSAACKANWTADCGDKRGCIKWNPGTGSNDAALNVDGRVKFSDSCTAAAGDPVNTIGRTSSAVNYTGKGILYSTKDMLMKGDILSRSSNPGPPATNEYFVKDNLMAVMSKGKMKIGSPGSPIQAMGAFYALEQVTSNQNSTIVGSLMSNSFDMTGGTTSIYYMDKMSDELDRMGMIKSEVVYTFKTYVWEEKWQ